MNRFWFFVAATLQSLPVGAESFRVAYYDGGDVPFVILNKQGVSGIFPDLMAAIMRQTGDQLNQQYMPIKRILKSFEDGQLDIEVGANPKWRANSTVPGLYSTAFATGRAVLCYRPGELKTNQAVADFYGQKIGLIAGYNYPEFDAAFAQRKIRRADIFTSTSLLMMLKAQRFDQIIISIYVKQYWQKFDPQRYACEEGRVVDENGMLLRLHPSKAEALPRLNAAIEALKKSGEIDAIFRRYTQ